MREHAPSMTTNGAELQPRSERRALDRKVLRRDALVVPMLVAASLAGSAFVSVMIFAVDAALPATVIP